MKKAGHFLLLILFFATNAMAQDDLFGTEKKEAKEGFLATVSASLDFPLADMATRFGVSNRIGPAIYYKTESNWMFGAKVDFIFGKQINEPSFLSNLLYTDGTLLSATGYRVSTTPLERGYIAAIEVGRIFPIKKNKPENGLLLMSSIGFMQHKIFIANKANDIPQLNEEYLKGYDRLTNGISIEQFIAYNHISNSDLVNFTIGINITEGFTGGRRDYWFDVSKAGNDKRFDMLIGIKGNWYIPLYKRKSEDIYFE